MYLNDLQSYLEENGAVGIKIDKKLIRIILRAFKNARRIMAEQSVKE